MGLEKIIQLVEKNHEVALKKAPELSKKVIEAVPRKSDCIKTSVKLLLACLNQGKGKKIAKDLVDNHGFPWKLGLENVQKIEAVLK